jgi:multimeric flavodoxin WrbA
MKALVLSASPRHDGNSAKLAEAMVRGLEAGGHTVELLHVDSIVSTFLGDCRRCRRADGSCSIDDGFREVFLEKFLPADGMVAATPVYWYGMSAQLKSFFDRMFCYVAVSHPQSATVVSRLQGKRIGLLLSSEETYPGVGAGIVHQMQEYCRYTRSTFVGLVHGHGNARGDVLKDPSDPVGRAERFGRRFFEAHASDYHIDTPRPARVWG